MCRPALPTTRRWLARVGMQRGAPWSVAAGNAAEPSGTSRSRPAQFTCSGTARRAARASIDAGVPSTVLNPSMQACPAPSSTHRCRRAQHRPRPIDAGAPRTVSAHRAGALLSALASLTDRHPSQQQERRLAAVISHRSRCSVHPLHTVWGASTAFPPAMTLAWMRHQQSSASQRRAAPPQPLAHSSRDRRGRSDVPSHSSSCSQHCAYAVADSLFPHASGCAA